MSNYSEYDFDQSETIHYHSYLAPTVMKAIPPSQQPGRVVDLGCGDGSLLASFEKQGWKSYGVDLSESGIAAARRKFPGIEFHCKGFDDALVRELGAAQFDLVISTEVVEHLYAPRELPRIAFQLLKPGGLMVVSTPYHGYLKNCALALSGNFDRHFSALWDCGHIKFWSYKTLQALLREAGFTSFHFFGSGRVPFLWKSMVVSAQKPSLR